MGMKMGLVAEVLMVVLWESNQIVSKYRNKKNPL